MELTNRNLALLLVVAIAVSLTGTIFSLDKLGGITTTGHATALSNVSITSLSSIKFSIAAINFGAGLVNSSGGYNNCTMYSNNTAGGTTFKTSGCVNFTAAQPFPLVIENDGNINVTVQLGTSNNATVFIGGVAITPVYQYEVYLNETVGCGALNPTAYTWTDVNASSPGTMVCPSPGLDWHDTADTIAVGIKLVIPQDASGVNKQSTLTVTGT
jgi:hypothetical protein